MTRSLLAVVLAAAACTPAAPATAPPPTPSPSAPASSPIAVPPETPAAATPRLAATPPRRIEAIGGFQFAVVESPADLYVETSVAEADIAALSAQVAADVRDVEAQFDRRFARRPTIYVLATLASYTSAMSTILGYGAVTADWIAEDSVAFFEPPVRTIVLNWEAASVRRPLAAIRHELTHDLTLEACDPRCDLVPAWLNEGQARLAEALIPGSDWRLARVRYEAASMAATATLIPLRDLVSQSAWNSLASWAGYYKYQQAARTVELLREDVGGSAPIARVYEHLRRGESIAQAYAALAGRPFDAFLAALPARMAAIGRGPGILALPTASGGPGASYLLYGFVPESPVTVTISGRGLIETIDVTVSPFGAAYETVASELPPGRHSITAVSGSVTVSASVVKSVKVLIHTAR